MPETANMSRGLPNEPLRLSAGIDSQNLCIQRSDIQRLATLVEEQIAVLRRIDQRQAANDVTHQPMPEVPATSSSAWNALLRSALTDTIQPKIDRWRSGLDALLVFLGLFSGIVTTFFVGTLNALTPDETTRTNELLANLTNIVVVLSGRTNISYAQPTVFQPDPADVRLNSYWSLSLVLSLSLAALAVVCRGFLNMAAFSPDPKASGKLVDIKTRWGATERILGTTIEALPPLLVAPVLLFISGLLDSLFSSVLQLTFPPASILVTSGISLLCFVALVSFLIFTAVDGVLNPTKSPFQSTLSRLIRSRLPHSLLSHFSLGAAVDGRLPVSANGDESLHSFRDDAVHDLSRDAKIFHEVIQTTQDDESLDQAAAALLEVIRHSVHPTGHRPRIGPMADEEHATLLHLLSPEASIRSSRTAAQVIIRLHAEYFHAVSSSEAQIDELVPALSAAAKRSCLGNSLSTLWESPFLRAMAIVVDPDLALKDNSSAVWILASDYSSWDHLPSTDVASSEATHAAVISFLLKVITAKLLETLTGSTHATEAGIVDAILSPHANLGETLNLHHLLAALLHVPSHDDLTLLILWLCRLHAPLTVIRAAHDNLEDISTEQVLYLGQIQLEMFPMIAATIGVVCLAQEDFVDYEPLQNLCVFTFFRAVPVPSHIRADQRSLGGANWGLFNLVETILAIANAAPLPDPGSPLLNNLFRVREVLLTLSETDFKFSVPHGHNADLAVLLDQFEFIHEHATAASLPSRSLEMDTPEEDEIN